MSLAWITTDATSWLGTGLIVVATGYACVALLAVLVRMRRAPVVACSSTSAELPAVSVLKPLHGVEPQLHENLRSFCRQSHPEYQLVFGVRDPDDPAIAIVQRLRREFPQRDMALVVDARVHGANLKVSNLMNMLPHARHDWLVLADSDIRVPHDYLLRVTAPLADADVGIVTCLYRGIAGRGLWPRLGRLFIDDWFNPSVQLAAGFGSRRFAFGSTIALRRDVLTAIGGFRVLRDTLADDFMLGELTRRHKLRTILSDLMVGTQISETRLSTLWAHELRWLRTIRAIAPWRFVMTCVCFTSPMLVLGLCLSCSMPTIALAVLGGGARLALNLVQRRLRQGEAPWHDALLVPLRDTLSLLEWATALAGWRVKWQGQVLHARNGDPTSHI